MGHISVQTMQMISKFQFNLYFTMLYLCVLLNELSCQWSVPIPNRLKKTSEAVEEAVLSEFSLFGRQLLFEI